MPDEPAATDADTTPPVDPADVEGDDDGGDHAVPPELLELYEVQQWQSATTGIENPAGDQ